MGASPHEESHPTRDDAELTTKALLRLFCFDFTPLIYPQTRHNVEGN